MNARLILVFVLAGLLISLSGECGPVKIIQALKRARAGRQNDLSDMREPLKIIRVDRSAFNRAFSPNGAITVDDSVADFVTNLPSVSTKSPIKEPPLGGFLQSRTIEGKAGSTFSGRFGYEYRLNLHPLSGTKREAISSITIPFPAVSKFDFNGQANNDVWVVTNGDIGTIGPASAFARGSAATLVFKPPNTISTNSETSTYFFGLLSTIKPPARANSWASFKGTEISPSGGTLPFDILMVEVRTP